MPILSNKEILALARDDQSFKKWTSELTKDIFEEKGFEELARNDYQKLADFFNLSIRVYLQKVKRPEPRIPKTYTKIVEEYSNEYGGIAQRINTRLLKPTSPKFRNLQNGGSIDPFIVRKPETTERFFQQNFDFQNHLTIQDIELRKMFLSENGISEYIAGIMGALDDSYVIQKYETMRELLSKAINSTNNPLKESQKLQVPDINENSTNADMSKFIQVFKNLKNLFDTTVTSGQFNAKGYEHGLYPDRYTLMVRSDVITVIQTTLMATSYHLENLGLDFDVMPVKDFGGLTYTDNNDVALVPIYDDFGAVKGFGYAGSTEVLPDENIKVVDPNKDICAVLAQKGVLFTQQMQPYETQAIYNPAGRYTNFWASQPNASFNYDACYDLITFTTTPSNRTKKEKTTNK